MAGSVNKVILVGNLGKDPEVRSTQDGSKIVNLTLATSDTWNDRASGERKERTEWHRVVIFNDRVADVAERFLKKGAKIYVEGSLQTRKWTDQQGQERYTTEVVIGRFQRAAHDAGWAVGRRRGRRLRRRGRGRIDRRWRVCAARARPGGCCPAGRQRGTERGGWSVLGCAEGRRSGRRNSVLVASIAEPRHMNDANFRAKPQRCCAVSL